eukprot:4969755-Amphidinium_carterae.1
MHKRGAPLLHEVMKQAPALSRKEVDVDDKRHKSLMDLTVYGKRCADHGQAYCTCGVLSRTSHGS